MADETFSFEEATAPAAEDQGFSFEEAQHPQIDPTKLAAGINLGLQTIGQVTAPVFNPLAAQASEGARTADLEQFESGVSPKLENPKLAGARFLAPRPEDLFPGTRLRPPTGIERFAGAVAQAVHLPMPYENREGMMGRETAETPLQAIQIGSENVIRPLVQPPQLAIMAGTGALGEMGEVGALLTRAINGYFGAEAAKSAAQAIPGLLDPQKSFNERLQHGVEVLASLGIAVSTLRAAARPGADIPIVKAGREVLGPPATGEFLRQRPQALPEPPKPIQRATPAEAARRATEMQRQAEAGEAAIAEVKEGQKADVDALVKTQPGAVDPKTLDKLSEPELAAYFQGRSGRQISTQYDGVLAGVHLAEKDVPELEKMRDEAQKKGLEAIQRKDQDAYFGQMGKVVWLNGAIEGAKKKGPNWDAVKSTGQELEQAAYKHDDGTVHTGANHPEILQRLGIKGFENPESRNTPQFGFRTKAGRFVEREEAARIAQVTGQDLKKFEPGEPAHSDEVSTPGQPTVPISETGPKKIGRGVSGRTRFENETQAHGEDLLSWIANEMPLLSKSQAQKQMGAEKFAQNKSLYDDAPQRLASPHHNQIFSERGSSPDRVAQAAFEAGLIKEPHERALWARIIADSKKRADAVKGAKAEAARLKVEAQQFDEWSRATSARGKANNIEVTTEELKPGDVLEVEGEQIKVKSRDPDTGELTLDDGRKFGTQVLEEGKRIYVENVNMGPESTEFLPPGEIGRMTREEIEQKVKTDHPNAKIDVIDDPNEIWNGQYSEDENGNFVGIRINAAKIKNAQELEWVIEHEFSHAADRLKLVENLQDHLTTAEFDTLFNQIKHYNFDEMPEEIRARALQTLADAWRDRNWFQQVVGHLEGVAEKFGLKMTRLGAERSAAQAIANAAKATVRKPTLLPPGETQRPLTPAEQEEFQNLSIKARNAREAGGAPLTTEETQRYEYLSALAGQQQLLTENLTSGAAQRIKTMEDKIEQLDKLRTSTLQRAYKSVHRREQLFDEAKLYQFEIDALRNEINSLRAQLKGSGNPKASTAELFDVQDNADYSEVGQGMETRKEMTAASTINGLPKSVADPGPDFPAELMEASRRLGTLIRTRATLLPRYAGLYTLRRAGVMMSDKIEVADLQNTRTMAHEMGHDLDQLLWPQVNLAKTQKSLVPRAGSFGTIKEIFGELLDVTMLMRGLITGSKGHKAYRRNSAELVADFFSLYAHDPDLARQMAPRFSKAFEAALDRNPEAQQTIKELHAGDVKPISPETALSPTGKPAGMPGKVPARQPAGALPREAGVARAAEESVTIGERVYQAESQRGRIQADNWRKDIPKANDRNNAGAFIEGGGNLEIKGDTRDAVVARVSKNPKLQQFIKDFRLKVEKVRGEINTYLKDFTDGEYLSWLQDYLPHFYVNSKSPAVGEAVSRWAKNSPNAKERKIPTLQEAHEMGLTPITQDPATLYEVWSKINWRVATNRRVVGELGKMVTSTGEPVLMPAGQAPSGYVKTDNPLIQRIYARQKGAATELWRGGAAVHPDAWRAVRMILENPTSSDLGKAYDVLNSMARANAFAFSFFHDFTLNFASTGAQWRWYNPARGLFRLFEKNPLTGELEIFRTTRSLGKELAGDEKTVVDAAMHGLKFSWNDSESYQFQSRDFLEKAAASWRGVPYLGKSVAFLRDLQHMRQKGLWKNTHDALKLAAYQDMVAKALTDAPAGVDPTAVKKQIASLLNDTFGGQEWITKFWLSPTSRKIMSRFMLAPDWTLSTIRSVPGVSDIASTVRGQLPRVAGREPIPVNLEGLEGNMGRMRFWKGELAAIGMATLAAQYAIYQAFGDKRKGDKAWMWENEYGQRNRIDVTPLMRKMPWHKANDPTRYYVNLGKRPAEILSYFTDFDRIIAAKAARPVAELWKQITSTEGDFKAPWKRDHASFVEQIPQRAKSAGQAFLPFVFQGNQFALSFPYRKGMTKYKAQQAYESVYELAAEPDKFKSTTRSKALMRGVPMPEGTLKEMVRQIDDAALRNGVQAHEDIRQRALSTVRGKYLDDYFKAVYVNNDQKAGERAATAYFNLGGSNASLNQSINRRIKLQPSL